MGRHVRNRKCKHCHEYFLPDYRNRIRQKFCDKPACRKASKTKSQHRWLQKPQNRDYFKGPVNVARVQQWRKGHPGYWRKKASASDALQDSKAALQESLPVETLDNREVAQDKASVASPLQDVLPAQDPVLIGLIAQLTGSALQDDIATYARHLRQLGHDILNPQFSKTGGSYDRKTSLVPGANPQAPGGVFLARPPADP